MAAEAIAADLATTVGECWVREMIAHLHAADREVVGAWPGTLREARMRIRVALRRHVESEIVDDLARRANIVARSGWLRVAVSDPE